jgi:hypothetical protein
MKKEGRPHLPFSILSVSSCRCGLAHQSNIALKAFFFGVFELSSWKALRKPAPTKVDISPAPTKGNFKAASARTISILYKDVVFDIIKHMFDMCRESNYAA